MQKIAVKKSNYQLRLQYKIYLKTEDGLEKWSENFFYSILSHNSVICIFLKRPHKGYLIARRIGKELEILSLGVDKSNRRLGVAEKMLSKLLKIEKKNKPERILLEVSIKNKIAIKFYKRSGFHICNVRKNYYSERNKSIDAYMMAKEIIKKPRL